MAGSRGQGRVGRVGAGEALCLSGGAGVASCLNHDGVGGRVLIGKGFWLTSNLSVFRQLTNTRLGQVNQGRLGQVNQKWSNQES